MKSLGYLFTAIALFFFNAEAAPAPAATTATPQATSKPTAAAPQAPAPAAKASTAADWANICKFRRGADAKGQAECLDRNKDKIGKPITESQSKQAVDGAAGKVKPKKDKHTKGKHTAKKKANKKKK